MKWLRVSSLTQCSLGGSLLAGKGDTYGRIRALTTEREREREREREGAFGTSVAVEFVTPEEGVGEVLLQYFEQKQIIGS